MKKNWRKIFSVMLALIMVVTLIPFAGMLKPIETKAVGDGCVASVKFSAENVTFNNATINVEFFDADGNSLSSVYQSIGAEMENNYSLEDSNVGMASGISYAIVKLVPAGQPILRGGIWVNGTDLGINEAQITSADGQRIDFDGSTHNFDVEVVLGVNGGENPNPPLEGEGNEFDFDVTFVATNVCVSLEGMEIVGESDLFDQEEYKFSGKKTVNATNNPNEENLMSFRARFGDRALKYVEVNGTKYSPDLGNVVVDETDGTWSISVPGDIAYTINGVADMEAAVQRTIIWVNPDYQPTDADDAAWVADFTIDHGYAKAVAVYDENGNPVDVENGGLDEGFGWIPVMPGWTVQFEFFPEYGYQLTGITLNEQPMDASNVANQYTVKIPDANLHFGATFTKTSDVVKPGTTKVTEGNIQLGSALKGGSAQLTINDANVSAEKTAAFQAAAGDYTVGAILDVDFYNVFYKGKDDPNDVWSNQIDELDADAIISVKLAEGINADDIVIVHNIHDGTDFEVLQIISYDPETRILTFKAKSFSNFAIATKGSGSNASYNTVTPAAAPVADQMPKTSETFPVALLIMLSVISLGAMTTVVVKRRKM